MDSILNTIKHLVGPGVSDSSFDVDLVIHINSAFSILHQLGVGPSAPFRIQDDTSVWSDFSEDPIIIDVVKTYIYEKVRLIFDPPSQSSVLEALKADIKELEWRVNTKTETESLLGVTAQ